MASERGPRFIDTLLPASIVRTRFFLQYHLAFWSHEPIDQIEHAIKLLDSLEEDTIRHLGRAGWTDSASSGADIAHQAG
jgi:hypothetical protein